MVTAGGVSGRRRCVRFAGGVRLQDRRRQCRGSSGAAGGPPEPADSDRRQPNARGPAGPSGGRQQSAPRPPGTGRVAGSPGHLALVARVPGKHVENVPVHLGKHQLSHVLPVRLPGIRGLHVFPMMARHVTQGLAIFHKIKKK